MSKTQVITVQSNLGPREVEAIVIGAWAVHRRIGQRGWAITHVASGLGIPHQGLRDATKQEAIRAAREINARFGDIEPTHATGERIGTEVNNIIWDALMGKQFTP